MTEQQGDQSGERAPVAEQAIVTELQEGFGWRKSLVTGAMRVVAPAGIPTGDREAELVDELIRHPAWSIVATEPTLLERAP